MMINCDACKGKKKMIGLGNLIKDCNSCNGVGWIELPSDDLKVTLNDVMNNTKQRGRKKKVIEPVLQC